MSNKEVRISHLNIKDPQTITEVTTNAMKEAGVDIHQNEVARMDDDFKTGERVLSIEKKQHFVCPAMPWHRKEN